MAFDFPATPTVGQEYTSGGATYVWDTVGWKVKAISNSVASGTYVVRTGDTMTGTLTIKPGGGTWPALYLDRDTLGKAASIWGQLNGVNRWQMRLSNGDAADNFTLTRYDDAGVSAGTPLTINRANGLTTLAGDLTVTKNTPYITTNKTAAAQDCGYFGTMNGANRWSVILGHNSTEGGSNAGSDFYIYRYPDAGGGPIEGALTISRASGALYFTRNAQFGTGATTGSSSLTVQGPTTGTNPGAYLGAYNGGTGLCVIGNYSAIMGGAWDARGCIWSNSGVIYTPGKIETTTIKVGTSSDGVYGCVANICFAGGGAQYGMQFRPVTDSTYPVFFFNAAGTAVGNINQTTTTTVYNTSSDVRQKDDLKTFDSARIIDNTEVYDFAWKSTGERAYGVLAQQAVEFYPNAITHEEQQDSWFVDYSKYVPILLQELKTLRARVAALEGMAAPKAG